MKLPLRKLKLTDQLDEFDIWITPSLGEIVDTDKFKEEMRLVSSTFDSLIRLALQPILFLILNPAILTP